MKFGLKKVISVILVCLLVFFSVPASVFAQNTSNSDSSDRVSNVEYGSDSAVGNILLNSNEVKSEREEAAYNVNSVVLYGSTAVANVSVKNECTLVVGIYDEEGKLMYGSGKEKASASDNSSSTEIVVDLSVTEMPEYFLVRAFLLDENNQPLCEYYENIEYTKAFEEFSAKTTADFDEEKIINLDESDSENFLVVTDDAKIIKSNSGSVTYGLRTNAVAQANKVVVDDYTNGYYVIENISDEIRDLTIGEVFFYEYGEGDEDYIIAKIETIEIEGNTAVITAAPPEDLTEYFQFANIDMESSESTFDNGGMDENVQHESEDFTPKTRDININNKKTTVHKWYANIPLGKDGEIDIGVETAFTFTFKLYIDFYIFGIRSAYTELSLGFDSDVKCKITASGYEGKIPLGTVGLSTGSGITVGVVVNFVVEVEAEVEVSFKITETRIGFYLDKKGFKDKSNFYIADFNPEFEQGMTLFVGLSIEPTVKATKFIEAKLSGKAGLELAGKNNEVDTKTVERSDGSKIEAIHTCEKCIDLDLGMKIECKFNIKFFKIINSSYKLLDKFIKFGDYYLSVGRGFGLGECPYYNCDLKVLVTDSVGNPVANAVINGKSKTDVFGEATAYAPIGLSVMSATSPLGQKGSTEVYYSLDGEIPTVRITLKNESGIKDFGEVSENISWKLYTDGELIVEGEGAMPDFSYSYEAPWKKYGNEVKRISIADGITVIGERAFDGFSCVGEIALPASLTEIKYNALVCSTEKASNLAFEYETEEEAKEEINKLEVLVKNEDFLQLRIPKNLENIDASNFSSSTFSCFVVDENNLFFSSDSNGALYNKEKTRLINYPFASLNDEYIVPETVTQIDENALFFPMFLDRLIIPDSVKGNLILMACVDLYEVQLGKGITDLGIMACLSLEALELPGTVKRVSVMQSVIDTLILPSGVTDLTIDYDDSIKTIYLPLTVTYVSLGALSGREIYYQGSEEDFKKIKHGDYGDVINVKSVVYNSYFPGESSSVYARTLSNSDEINSYSNTTDYDSCVIIVVRDKNAEDLLNSENLIYINQQENTGEIPEFDWILPEGEDEHYVLYTFANLDMINHKHSYDEGTVTAPTCTGKGFTTYTCACGDSFVADEVDKVPHNLTEKETVAEATCTKEGVKHIGCSECDYYEVEKTPQTNHKYNKVVTAPTCTGKGFTTYTCACGDSFVADEVDKVPHNLTVQEIITEADCTREGKMRICCSECDYYETTTIPQTNHNYVKEVVAADCTDGGYTIYRCSCGLEYIDDFTGVTDHVYSENGVCNVCGHEKEKEACDHICHKNGFIGFIYKIIRIFWKFFKINKTCACGVNHY